MKKHTAKEQELADNARLLREWRNWHAEELAEALAGPHRHVLEPLMQLLENLNLRSSATLLDFIRAQNWSAVDAQTKLTVLHEISTAICKLRERNGKAPIDDALWGEPATAFQVIRSIVIPIEGKPAAGRSPANQNDRRL
jgi:hypothetical protein